MFLNDIDLSHGTAFSCECRVRYPLQRTAKNGSRYLSLMIEDSSMSLKANVWSEHFDNTTNVIDLDKVLVTGKIREFNREWLANISSIQHITEAAENPLQLIPHSLCPLSPLLDRLHNIVGQISHDALRNFVGWVFSDDSFIIPFISAPASRRHHHSIAGGLPDDVRLVHAGSAGRAIGILQRDRNVYARIMLDHDLRGQMEK